MVLSEKTVLLIAGGGTLGTYTADELLQKGYDVDIICLEDKISDNKHLFYYKEYATTEFLTKLFSEKHYNGIVNFIHYPDVEQYKPVHKLLCENTEHLIFLSSYRVYADLEHPVTENAPMLLDVSNDGDFLKNEKYAISKAKCEKFIRSETAFKNWTIVRPVISFSERRLDIVVQSGHNVINLTKAGKAIPLPAASRYLTAGLDWAGNSGKLIANLLFKESATGEAYTISSAQNITWDEVAQYYTDLIGARFEWVTTEEFKELYPQYKTNPYTLIYDRLFDRKIDNTKVLKATGLNKDSFTPIKKGIEIELAKLTQTVI